MTSIEWLEQMIEEKKVSHNIRESFEQIFSVAKQMHKQEMKQVSEFWHRQPISKPIFNEYYQETFKK